MNLERIPDTPALPPGVPPRWFAWHVRAVDARGVVHRSRYFKERWMWGGPSYVVIGRALRGADLPGVVAGGVVALVGMLAMFLVLDLCGVSPGWIIKVGFPLGMALGLVMRRMTRSRIAAERVLADWTRQMRPEDPCIACGYSLAGAASASDGCVECPECGAAWRIAERETRARAGE